MVNIEAMIIFLTRALLHKNILPPKKRDLWRMIRMSPDPTVKLSVRRTKISLRNNFEMILVLKSNRKPLRKRGNQMIFQGG